MFEWKYKVANYLIIKLLNKKLKYVSYQIESIDFELQFNKDIEHEELLSMMELRKRFVNTRIDILNCIEILRKVSSDEI